MGLTDEERRSLVELREEKAKKFLREAEQMRTLSLWDMAANRYYYACFHAAQALLISQGLSAHTHAGTLGVFGINFIKTCKIDKSLGAFFSRMEQLRMKADYNCEYDVTQEEVESMSEPSERFVTTIESYMGGSINYHRIMYRFAQLAFCHLSGSFSPLLLVRSVA